MQRNGGLKADVAEARVRGGTARGSEAGAAERWRNQRDRCAWSVGNKWRALTMCSAQGVRGSGQLLWGREERVRLGARDELDWRVRVRAKRG